MIVITSKDNTATTTTTTATATTTTSSSFADIGGITSAGCNNRRRTNYRDNSNTKTGTRRTKRHADTTITTSTSTSTSTSTTTTTALNNKTNNNVGRRNRHWLWGVIVVVLKFGLVIIFVQQQQQQQQQKQQKSQQQQKNSIFVSFAQALPINDDTGGFPNSKNKHTINDDDRKKTKNDNNNHNNNNNNNSNNMVIAGYLPDYRSYINVTATIPYLTDLILFSIQPHSRGMIGGCCLDSHHYELGRQAKQQQQQQHDLNIWVTIGGGGRTEAIPIIMQDSQKRNRLIQNMIKLAERESINGIDLDCYPTSSRTQQQQQQQQLFSGFLHFLQEASTAWHNAGLLLSLALHPNQVLPQPEYYQWIDRIHLMTYDMIIPKATSSSSSTTTSSRLLFQHHADFTNVRKAVQLLIKSGCPKEKIILGVPGYGRNIQNPQIVKTFSEIFDDIFIVDQNNNINNKNNKKGQQQTDIQNEKAAMMTATKEDKHYHIDKDVTSSSSSSSSSSTTTTIVKNGNDDNDDYDYYSSIYTQKSHQGLAWDSPKDVQQKVQFAQDMGLGGVFLWELGHDKQHEKLAPGGFLLEAMNKKGDDNDNENDNGRDTINKKNKGTTVAADTATITLSSSSSSSSSSSTSATTTTTTKKNTATTTITNHRGKEDSLPSSSPSQQQQHNYDERGSKTTNVDTLVNTSPAEDGNTDIVIDKNDEL